MARAYPQDLRDRVMDAVVGAGLSRRAAARRFGVSAASAIRWLRRFQQTGSSLATCSLSPVATVISPSIWMRFLALLFCLRISFT